METVLILTPLWVILQGRQNCNEDNCGCEVGKDRERVKVPVVESHKGHMKLSSFHRAVPSLPQPLPPSSVAILQYSSPVSLVIFAYTYLILHFLSFQSSLNQCWHVNLCPRLSFSTPLKQVLGLHPEGSIHSNSLTHTSTHNWSRLDVDFLVHLSMCLHEPH